MLPWRKPTAMVVRPLQQDNESRSTTWTWLAYAWAALMLAGLAYFLVRVPFQVSDNLGNMLQFREASYSRLMLSQVGGPYVRPLVWGYFKLVADASQGHYFLAYKAVAIAQLILLLWLFVRTLQIRTAGDFAALPFALVVLFGLHTFGGLVLENYPINAHVTIAVCVFAALNLSESRGGALVDIGACLLLGIAMFIVETGLLVWVALVAAYMAGARGVSKRGLGVATLVFLGYFVMRFGLFGGGTPGLGERTVGYGFSVLEPSDLRARFGSNPTWFYLVNVVSSISTVLFSEPRDGIWKFTMSVMTHDLSAAPIRTVNVVSSISLSLLILAYSVVRLPRWVRATVSADERIVVLFWAVAAANATLGYGYCKDQIMTVAGCLYAGAAFVVVRDLVRREGVWRPSIRVGVAAAMLLLGCAWVVRAIGLPYDLTQTAYTNRNDWVTVEAWIQTQPSIVHQARTDARFIQDLRAGALGMYVPHPFAVYSRVGGRWIGQRQ